MKKPFVTLEQLQTITQQYPTPFHLYDEKGIRDTARALYKAFSWNPGYREFFAVKATPNPQILKILKEEGCGTDCSSLTELMMSDRCGFAGDQIMFSSNDTPAEEFALAAKLGATINLDDISHIDFLKDTIGYIPKKISCRYNPGGTFTLGESEEGFQVMDNPGQAKYGMTRPQMTQAFRRLKELGAEEFGIHAFLASNTLSNEYYPALAAILFQMAVELKNETGCHITFINLSGGVGVPYLPDQPANDIAVIGEGVRRAYEDILVPAGMGDVSLCTELGRFMLAPNGHLVTRVLHEKQTYKDYIGVDACAALRPPVRRHRRPVREQRQVRRGPDAARDPHRRSAGHPRHRGPRPRHGLSVQRPPALCRGAAPDRRLHPPDPPGGDPRGLFCHRHLGLTASLPSK